FVCTFTTGGLKEEIRDGRLVILQEGRQKKFVKVVQQITFSGRYARSTHQDVQFITERAVFRLTEEGLLLTEIAPGVELERDILAQMEFSPQIAENLSLMDPRIFRDAPMGLAAQQ
ncbi:MAG: 3-oxoacid CoA-transferase, partial [Oscillospiraceae bacterium]|nr:3-oxoacid CoA-transferase [Oscillospiraceae bacterium]